MFNMKKLKKNFIFGVISKMNIKLFITLICFAFLGTSIYGNFESLSNQILLLKRDIMAISRNFI